MRGTPQDMARAASVGAQVGAIHSPFAALALALACGADAAFAPGRWQDRADQLRRVIEVAKFLAPVKAPQPKTRRRRSKGWRRYIRRVKAAMR